MIYAVFWRRIGAGFVDTVILHIIGGVLLSILGISVVEDPNSYSPDVLNNLVKRGFMEKATSLGIGILIFPIPSNPRYDAP